MPRATAFQLMRGFRRGDETLPLGGVDRHAGGAVSAQPRERSARELVHELHATARAFAPAAAARKLALLGALGARALPARGPRRRELDAALAFLRAYPDAPRVLRAVEALLARLPAPPPRTYAFQYGVARRLARVFPGIELDWDDVEDDSEIADALALVQLPGEAQGAEDVGITFAEWFRAMRPPRGFDSDLEALVDLFERSGLGLRLRAHLFDRCRRARRPRSAERRRRARRRR
jgi:hypothetical protein